MTRQPRRARRAVFMPSKAARGPTFRRPRPGSWRLLNRQARPRRDLPVSQGRQADDALRELAAELGPTAALGSDEDGRAKCRDAWGGWWRGLDDSKLLDFFRSRTLPDAERDKILALIKQLGDDDFDVRERAVSKLLALAAQAEPLLEQAARKDADPEVRSRAQRCLGNLKKDPSGAATARLVALRRPPGAAAVLLDYLPFADDSMTDEVQNALSAFACQGGKADDALVGALDDKVALRRSAAAMALCRCPDASQYLIVRKLLSDPDVEVRFHAAAALAA